MTPPSTPVVELLNRFVLWAESQADVRAVLVIGSRARADRPADQWSDVDLIIAASNPRPYLEHTAWLNAIGKFWVTHVEPTLAGVSERRVMFEGGLDFDLVLVTDSELQKLLQNPEVASIVRRGIRILVDKDRVMSRITLPIRSVRPYVPPTQAEFTNLVNDFWYHAVWTAKKLRRGELWTAILSCDHYMKLLLVRMLEWHTHAISPENYDTWFSGRFLEEWADQKAIREMSEAFAHYSARDIARALLVTMDLFRRVATETAAQLTYEYPYQGDTDVTEWVENLLTDLH